MNSLTDNILKQWRSYRTRKMLQPSYSARYAFVGAGSHALQNLYPVIEYLGIRLKYICCTSEDKLPMIRRRFGVTATCSLDMILEDDEVAGVFVCTSPESHYGLSMRVIDSGKYLFVEKPPCMTRHQLNALTDADRGKRVMTGMQKRYSPFIRTLKKHLKKEMPINYRLVYHTGAYPEGDPVTDLFIHPIDTAVYLFGTPGINCFQKTERNGTTTIQILLSHGGINGVMELSTAYAWSSPEERICINTADGEYRLDKMESLCYYPHPKRIMGMPLEKTGLYTSCEKTLVMRDNFNPLIRNNQIYSQGFLSEITAFADMVERSGTNLSPLSDMADTYDVLSLLRE